MEVDSLCENSINQITNIFFKFNEVQRFCGFCVSALFLLCSLAWAIASASSQVFSVIPDPSCAPWDYLRSREEFDMEESELFGRLRRAPGTRQAMSEEGWIAHWQMVGFNCLVQ